MIKTGKHCVKMRNCMFCAISSFVTMFLKSCLLQRHQKASIWGKGLNLYWNINWFVPWLLFDLTFFFSQSTSTWLFCNKPDMFTNLWKNENCIKNTTLPVLCWILYSVYHIYLGYMTFYSSSIFPSLDDAWFLWFCKQSIQLKIILYRITEVSYLFNFLS